MILSAAREAKIILAQAKQNNKANTKSKYILDQSLKYIWVG
jgi:hypothetical protein